MNEAKNIYSKEAIQDVRDKALIIDHLPPTSTSGRRNYVKCPQCGAFGKVKGKLKGLIITDKEKMHIAKCFDCGFSLASAIDAEMYYGKVDFRKALETCASKANIPIETEADREKRINREREKRHAGSFVSEQLAASGLTFEDVMVRSVGPKGVEEWVPAFRRGSIDHLGNINPNDDEMLICYYDLYGNPVKYAASTRGNPTRQYVRVRWSVPGLHLSREGKEMKYQTPRGAQTKFYIPQKIRDAFANKTPIDTLIVQEGEKKAEKACKHGILSIGIQGIFNIGNAQQGLMKDLSYIVKTCNVKNVILLFDSDWQDLSKNIESGDHADNRPKSFAKAAIKFRDYVKTLYNEGSHVEIWFGHLTGDKEKGIDDLLCGSLAGHEYDLKEDFDRALLTHDGKGTHANFYKISTLTNFQIYKFWGLNTLEDFVNIHSERLKDVQEMRFGGVLYCRTESGGYAAKSEDGSNLKFWTTSINEKNNTVVEFNRGAILKFLSANNYRNIHTSDLDPGEYIISIIDGPILRRNSFKSVKNFIYKYLVSNCKDTTVTERYLANMGKIVSQDVVDQLECIDYDDFFSDPHRQILPYLNGFVEITADDITGNVPGHVVWDNEVIPRQFDRVQIFDKMEWENGRFEFHETPVAKECEFLKFLKLTSDFWHGDTGRQDLSQLHLHLFNKMSCIGYLLHSYKDMTETKAIVAMDGRMSEVGKSNGRSGKSLVALALKQLIPQVIIDGRSMKASDEFAFNSVNLQTRTVLFDDVNVNFDFGRLFAILTNAMTVNYKGGRHFDIPFERSPKVMITTNHALSSDDDSSKARRVFMAFSEYFNANHTPKDEFGHAFFQEWDERQWCLFDNFMLECLQMHLRARRDGWEGNTSGLIRPPMAELEARQLRQIMGEDFLDYAEQYYGGLIDNEAINKRISRRDLQAKFRECPGYGRYFTPAKFRTRLEAFVKFKKWHFNPHKPHRDTGEYFEQWIKAHPGESFFGGQDKANSVEYFTVSWDGNVAVANPFANDPCVFE